MMKKNIIYLSFYNIINKMQHFIYTTISLVISFALLATGLIYIMYIDYAYYDTLCKHNSKVALFTEIPENYDIEKLFDLKKCLKNKNIVSEVRLFSNTDIIRYVGINKLTQVNEGKISLIIENKIYEDNNYDKMVNINICYDDTKLIPYYYERIYSSDYEEESLLKVGKMPSNSNEILINEKFLEAFGIKEDELAYYCGKKIDIKFDEIDVLKDMIISGVMRSVYSEIAEADYSDIIYSDSLINGLAGSNVITLAVIPNSFDSSELEYIRNELNEKYNIALEGNYSYDVLSFLDNQKRVTNKIIYIFMFLIFICSITNIIIYLVTNLHENQKHLAVYLAQGMTIKQVLYITISELSISSSVATILCLIMLSILIYIYNSKIINAFIVQLNIPVYIIVLSCFTAAIVVSSITHVVYIVILNNILKKKSVSEILKK